MSSQRKGRKPRDRARIARLGPYAGGAGVVGGVGVGGLRITGAPWWGMALVVVISLVIFALCALLQIALPQDSSDKVVWWDALLQYLERRETRRKPVESPLSCGQAACGGKCGRPATETETGE